MGLITGLLTWPLAPVRGVAWVAEQVAPYKRIRRIEFVPADGGLPKTISGKIRRVELRSAEQDAAESRSDGEYREDDFPDLKEPR